MFGLELSFIWAGIIAFAVLVYVILDGFDLGVGLLFPLTDDEQERNVMMNSVAPIWDGNETWLVLGGGGLFAVFPLAYAVVMEELSRGYSSVADQCGLVELLSTLEFLPGP